MSKSWDSRGQQMEPARAGLLAEQGSKAVHSTHSCDPCFLISAGGSDDCLGPEATVHRARLATGDISLMNSGLGTQRR